MNDVDAAGLGDFVTKPFGSISRPEPKALPLQPPHIFTPAGLRYVCGILRISLRDDPSIVTEN